MAPRDRRPSRVAGNKIAPACISYASQKLLGAGPYSALRSGSRL